MKVLYIGNVNDFDAQIFEEYHKGQNVSDIIKKIESGDDLSGISEDGDEYDFQAKILEVGEVDKRFVEFIRQEIQDYDDSKHHNFYLEGDKI